MFRWREEAQSLAGQLEQTEAKLRSQVASHKRRSEELSRLLKQSRAKHNEVRLAIGRRIKACEITTH